MSSTPPPSIYEAPIRDFVILAAFGWLCWPVPLGLFIRDLLRWNKATAGPPEALIAARRQVLLQGIVVVVDLPLAFVFGSFLLGFLSSELARI